MYFTSYIFGCLGVVQLGGLVMGYPAVDPTKVKAFLFTEASLKVEK